MSPSLSNFKLKLDEKIKRAEKGEGIEVHA
jgi:hypothetical protein